MSIFYYLDIDLTEKMCHPLAVTFLNRNNEPIPLFPTCDKSILDACLNLPKATFADKELYPNLVSKAAILYYSLIKNHPFINGNKRIATTSLIVFLYINNYWLDAGQNFLYNLALEVAQSKRENMDEVKSMLEQEVKKCMVSLKVVSESNGNIGFFFYLENSRRNLKKLFGK